MTLYFNALEPSVCVCVCVFGCVCVRERESVYVCVIWLGKFIANLLIRGRFLKNCEQLLRRAPYFLTAFSGEELKRQEHFLALKFLTRKSNLKVERQAQ